MTCLNPNRAAVQALFIAAGYKPLVAMAYWIYVTNSENWRITKKENILGASVRYKSVLSKVKKGDRCFIYVKSGRTDEGKVKSKIVGEYEVASTVFEDSKILFKAPPKKEDETFKLRIKLKPIKIYENPIDFKPLVQKLAFIKNKKHWALHFMGRAILEIPEGDCELIGSLRH